MADGIKTNREMIILKERLCSQGQGYFISRPLTRDEFERWRISQDKRAMADAGGIDAGDIYD